MSTSFRFAELAPDPRLAPWLGRYWEFSVHGGPATTFRVPPDGGTSLLVATGPGRLPLLLVSGPWLEPLAVPVAPGDRFWGVRLQPGAAREFLGIGPETLCNTSRPLNSLFGQPVAPLAAAIHACTTLVAAAAVMNGAFGPRIDSLAAPDPLAAEVVAFVVVSRGRVRISSIAERLAVSPRTLLRRFKAATGITPKQFARVIRFRFTAMELIESDARLSTAAAAGGYADQPHLTREWADLLGITPKQLAAAVKATQHDNVAL